MVGLGQLWDSYKLQREAKKVREKLKTIHIEAQGVGVKVTVSADMKIVSIEIAESAPREKLGSTLVDTLNRAMDKAQVVSAEHMKSVMGELGLPGA